MQINNVSQRLPGGLRDANLEVYAFGNDLWALYNGSESLFFDLPEDVIAVFRDDMLSNEPAMDMLIDLGITDPNDQLRQYVWCNFGGFNLHPDYSNGRLSPDYWDCGSRGDCPFEGKVCRPFNIGGILVTQRELQFIRLVAIGLADKQIASRLRIAYNTATKHRQNIEHKLGAASKVDIARFALQNNIVSSDGAFCLTCAARV